MNPNQPASVDVLIPAYNAADTIAESLNSIQQQTIARIRIIVVDDGSADATPEIIAELAAADPRIELIRKPSNSGIVDALNLGLTHCTAPFIARHDADDLAYPDRFAVQVAYLSAHPECLAVGAAARRVDADGTPLGDYARMPSPDLADPSWVPSREPYLMHPFLMVRREAVEAVGGYRHAFHAEDVDLYWRLQEKGRLYNLPDVLGDYRVHKGSITNRSDRNARVGALNAQLAAVSAVRRRAGKPDLAFLPGRLAEYEATDNVEDLLRVVDKDLTAEERRYVQASVAAKLAEASGYRLHGIAPADRGFIRRTLGAPLREMSPENTLELREKLISLGTRLMYHRQFRELVTLLPYFLIARVLQRTARFVTRSRGERLMAKLRFRRSSP